MSERPLIIGLSESIDMSPPVVAVGTAAFGLWVRCLCYSVHHDTDGFVPEEVACDYAGKGKRRLIDRLSEAGFWLPAEGGYKLVNGELGDGSPYWTITRDGRRESIPDEVRQRVYRRDGDECRECGSADDLTLDHIKPWSYGGLDVESNLRTLCRSCNSRKGNRH